MLQMVSQWYPEALFERFMCSLPFANKRVTLTYPPDFVHLRNDADIRQLTLGKGEELCLDKLQRPAVDAERIAERLKNKRNGGIGAAQNVHAPLDLFGKRTGGDDYFNKNVLLERHF